MIQILENYNLLGLIVGIATFLIIGLFHPIVIKAEYYYGTRCWWIFLLLGVVGIIFSIIITNILISALCGVFAFSSFWTIKELFEQKKRVEKGWFPKNPNKKEQISPKIGIRLLKILNIGGIIILLNMVTLRFINIINEILLK